jgi:putative ATP-dependent endonuclease of OLD family
MLKALKEFHPKIGASVEVAVNAAAGDAAKAKAFFRGAFERAHNNVQKGCFGQALAQAFMEKGVSCEVPDYIRQAVAHVCQQSQQSK